MIILLLILIGIVVFGLAAGYFYNRNIQKNIDKVELKEEPDEVTVDSECCVLHQICDKESLPAAGRKYIEYYDDEELDRSKCSSAEEYIPEEADKFHVILYNLSKEVLAVLDRHVRHPGI